MLEDAPPDRRLVELRAIGVDGARGAGERAREERSVRRTLVRFDPRSEAGGRHDEPHPVPPTQVACREGRQVLDGSVERSVARLARPELDRCIQHQPDHLALLALHLAHEQASAPGAGLPCDALERIAWHMVPELTELVPRSCQVRRPSHVGGAPSSPSEGRQQERAQARGKDLEAERVRKEERHLVEALAAELCAADLEGDPVQAPATDAPCPDGDVDEGSATRGQIDLPWLDRGLDHARRDRPERNPTHGLPAAVA